MNDGRRWRIFERPAGIDERDLCGAERRDNGRDFAMRRGERVCDGRQDHARAQRRVHRDAGEVLHTLPDGGRERLAEEGAKKRWSGPRRARAWKRSEGLRI